MKKFLLASLALGTLITANAKELAIIYDGETLPNNSSVKFDKVSREDYNDGQFIFLTLDPELKVISDIDATVSVKVESNEDVQLCTPENGAEGQCEVGTDLLKPNVVLKAGVPVNLLLDVVLSSYDGVDPEIPLYQLTVSTWYNDDPSNVYKLYLEMGGNAGVEGINAYNAVVFDGKSINYDLPTASQINVYSISGKVVANATVSGNGSIDLSHLAKGIYLYRISGKSPKTAKIIIR